MSDDYQMDKYESSGELLRVIQERSDDIERAIVTPPGFVMENPDGRKVRFPAFTLIFKTVSGQQLVVGKDDAEVVLNDGILTRMKVPIQLGYDD